MKDNVIYRAILAHHTSPEDVAEVFKRAAPKLAVFSHYLGLPGPKGIPSNVEIDVRVRTSGYTGPLLMGEDLNQFRISENGITVMRAGR